MSTKAKVNIQNKKEEYSALVDLAQNIGSNLEVIHEKFSDRTLTTTCVQCSGGALKKYYDAANGVDHIKKKLNILFTCSEVIDLVIII